MITPTPQQVAAQRRTVDERIELGRAARSLASRSSHRTWTAPEARPDPVALIEQQNESRVPWLVPLRHARMGVSPFTFFRGTACVMATDLAATASSGLTVQACGDAHLSNFGTYASPERQLVFDVNDFDETLPGPWEWDLKRLAASFTIAAQSLGFDESTRRTVTARAVKSYRKSMVRFGAMSALDLWYDHVTSDDIRQSKAGDRAELASRFDRFEHRARLKTNLQALEKLTVEEDGRRRIRSDPPVLFPLRDLPAEYDATALEGLVRAGLERYKESLSDDRRCLLERYRIIDVGVKVVGVGSVGTRCLIALLEGRDAHDPLFLQIKEADRSVLETHLGPGVYANSGRRVVEGQKLMQAESDIFLGWTAVEADDFYVRQLRDWKGSVVIDAWGPEQLELYARLCGMTLARGHARSGDAVAIGSYLGQGDAMDRAVTEFSESYAKQNQRDYEAFTAAVSDGRLPCADTI